MSAALRTSADYRAEAAGLRRVGRYGARALIAVALLALIFTTVNVQVFAAAGHPAWSFHWMIAWLLDPMASIALGTAIVFEGLLASYGRKVGWLTATKWIAGLATLAMNVWSSVVAAVPSGVVLHMVAPCLVLLLAEAAPRVRRHLAEIVAHLERQADDLAAHQVAEAQRQAGELANRQAEADAVARSARAAELAEQADHQVRQVVGSLASVLALGATLTRPRQVTPGPRQVTSPGATRSRGQESPGAHQIPAPGPGRSAHQVPDLAELVNRARPLLPIGRDRLARELNIKPHQARQVLQRIETETNAARPLHAVAGG